MRRGRFFILTVIILAAALLFNAGAVLAYDANPNIELLGSSPVSFNEWYGFDKAGAVLFVKNNRHDIDNIKTTFLTEWQKITEELSRLQGRYHLDSQTGMKIYSPQTTGKMHVLSLAKAYREAVLVAAGTGDIQGIAYPDLLKPGDVSFPVAELAEAAPDKYVTVENTLDTLRSISLPLSLFQDLTIYLMPYEVKKVNNTLGQVSGFHTGRLPGRDEVIYITALSKDEQGGFPPAATTITHEFGHYIHSILLGSYENNKVRWQPFLELGGNRNFVSDGPWAYLTDENFAEYFRLTYGNKEAVSYPYSSDYPSPNKERMAKFKAIIEANISNQDKAFWDYNALQVSVQGVDGKTVSLNAGPQYGNMTLITTSPEVSFKGYVASGFNKRMMPCMVFYRDGKLADTDEDFPEILINAVNATWKMGAPGKYYLAIGSFDPLNPPPTYIGNEGMITVYYIGAGPGTYKDISGHWAQKIIEKFAVAGYLNGLGEDTFNPNQPVTRAEFCSILANALGLSGTIKMPFGDLKKTDWYYDSVGYAYNAGIISGMSDSEFGPAELITREQMAVMLCNAVKYMEIKTGEVDPEAALAVFRDRSGISEWALDSVARAVSMKLMVGSYLDYGVLFNPAGRASRAEAVAVLDNLVSLLK